ncbi:MAG: hypothetical protein COZ75_05390 [Flavobacteriaceae bacterium CG_4_8_14_3_um_filter_34_10]|nr:DUF2007 domain-containing protein [Flavobacteriia bacterium]OIP52112.1 MAG: hypothetical protein AUK33_02105 [Flavobacteriaceae bacterium CG2_30_34_30]PIQ19345.1 MAG: hypothetical protein COW66_01490 [Flavobacteriaceae bacterium CG18_big_fil_WC_8_21_14_2_50_34_36]PIV49183.1 MAG: hypothetical protein COS19_09740 [Flavobacteriaceae bacterium CG02_land_8_20_14_3_00_34_13]PIX09683.1 MAG: hypothetical protein COZ75_05390 [Flavobacteriaceae bacterium CG_4_8_14_3_um_filter_34_10]PIZ08621.1 MAG: hy
MKNFKVVAVFTYSHEYMVLKLLLEQEGISYFFQNETMISVLPFHSNAIGGIRLMVHLNDISKVNEILDRLNNNKMLHIV